MEPQKTTAKDFFLNLGAIVALYTSVISLLNLLFTVINRVYPQTTGDYYYYGTSSNISWPVSILIIFFPIFLFLMWFLEKGFKLEIAKKNVNVRKWLTYITLFVAGVVLAGDLVYVLYQFIDGQELTTGFLLKILSAFVVTLGVFLYYISDIRGKLVGNSQKIWAIASAVVVIGSIVWGFSVLGSPATQRLYKYDDQKVNDLMNLSSAVESFYLQKNALPKDLNELSTLGYGFNSIDSQTQKSYEYIKNGTLKYSVCAEFNKDSLTKDPAQRPVGYISWSHPEGRYCFERTINPNNYSKIVPVM